MLIILVCWLALILIGASHREDNSPPLRKEQALSILKQEYRRITR